MEKKSQANLRYTSSLATAAAAAVVLNAFAYSSPVLSKSIDLTKSAIHNSLSLPYGGTIFLSKVAKVIDGNLSPIIKSILGNKELDRIEKFKNLPVGWDEGVGSPLKVESIFTANAFFDVTNLRLSDVSTFMSREGNLIFQWTNNGLIELEFAKDGIGFYIEATGDEGELPIASGTPFVIENLINDISLHKTTS